MINFLRLNFVGVILLSNIISACSSGSEVTDNTDKDTTVIHVDSLQKYPKSGEIKILSFNVRQATNEQVASNNWDFRKVACVDMIEDQKPTVIGLQEAVYSSQWTYLKEQLDSDYDGYGVGRDDGATSGETMGILWKKSDVEKLKTGTFWLSDSPDTPSKGWGGQYNRCVTWGLFKIKATGQIFVYMNTHLELSESVRSKEMALIIKKFAELNTDHYPQFFSADCNATSGDTIFNHFKNTMASARMSPL
jgi:endonuclease/exonuclease/phosphatase family metal-dependent hydrolase